MGSSARVAWVGIAALGVSLVLFALRPWLLDRAEYSLLDARFRARGAVALQGPIVVVAIDAASLDEFGRWPWSRSRMAELVDRLSEAGVAAMGLDMVFSESESPADLSALRLARRVLVDQAAASPAALAEVEQLDRSLARLDTDARLAQALAASNRAVLGYFFRTGLNDPDPEADLAARLPSLRRSQVAVAKVPSRARLPVLTCTGLETNLPALQLSGRRSGFLSALADPDGAVRRAALVARCGEAYYVSLGLAVYEVASGQRTALIGDEERLLAIQLGGRAFPVDEGGKILINYRGPPGTFPRLSAGDVLAGRVAPGILEGAVALIGPTEVGLGDTWSGPFPGAFPGVEVHANVLDNLMAGDVIRRQDSLVEAELAGILVIGLLLIVVIPRTRAAAASFLVAGILAGAVLLVGFVAFVEFGVWINIIYPLATVVLVYGTMEAARSLAAEARSRRVRNLFATYVPPSVVKELAEGDAPPRLGGETRTLSILFSDVCDFTSLSERLGAEDTIRLMNAYLAEMTRVVFDTGGTLDKYIGDAVMAFWGAPLSLDDHAHRAARAAVAMQELVENFAASHPGLPGAPELRMGVGIHTAPVVVGNLGSDLRFDYTLIGDGVNLCSRLEGLTRQYRVGILASADLVDRLPPAFLSREIDEIQVKGREGSTVIHELLGEAPRSPEGRALLDAYAEGLAQYRAGRFEAARTTFESIVAERGGDGASETLLARMRELGGVPPDGWEGVWSFQSK